jgi:hypothetical protein
MSTPENSNRDTQATQAFPVNHGAAPVGDGTPTERAHPHAHETSLREEVVAREKERFGGIKFGSAFFGWLTATGMAVILTALVAAAGAAVGLATNTDAQDAQQNAQSIGIAGAIALVVILFLSYYCAKQGLAVWIWALIIAVLAAILGAVAGSQFNILANLNSFPRIPIGEGDLTLVGVITAVVVALIALVGAILGGLAGMRFHRKVDREGLGA